jgi:phage-related protein
MRESSTPRPGYREGVPPTTIAKYYRAADGTQPVRDYRMSLSDTVRAAVDFHINLLNDKPENAPPPDFPTTSQIRGQLRELRISTARAQHRILYRRSEQFIVLLHAFEKNRGDVLEADINLAEQRFADFKQRMDAGPRQPPRPVGGDAPQRA